MADVGARPADVAALTGARRQPSSNLAFALAAPEASPAWRALAESSGNAFFAPEFAIPAIAALAPGARVAIVSDGARRAVAAAPVVRTRLGRIAPAARVFAHDYGPVGDPLVDPARLTAALRALVDGLSPPGTATSVVIPYLDLDGATASALGAIAAEQGRPVTIIGAHQRAILERTDATDLRAALPTRRRKEYARQLRRLADEAGTIRLVTATGDAALAAFEAYIALEASGWKGRAGTALAANPSIAAFARAAVANNAARGRVRVDTLLAGTRPVAILTTFQSATTAFTWKIAYDEEAARYSPGAQLMLDVPARIFAETGVTRIDSLATADHPMIDHLWPGRVRVGTLVIGPVGGGLLHKAGLALAGWEAAARERVRALLRR